MKRIMFLIHDLAQGGAEKVLVNLVNNMDREKFDITVIALFGGGVNEQFLKPHIRYRAVFPKAFPGNSHVMKLLMPEQLHRLCVKEHYDIEVAYLEGPSARIVSGCRDENTKKVFWVHSTVHSAEQLAASFRSLKEAVGCYERFDRGVFVSEGVSAAFAEYVKVDSIVLYNTNESEKITELSREPEESGLFSREELKLVGVGKLVENKGFHRLIPMVAQLRREGLPVHLYLLGMGSMEGKLRALAREQGVEEAVTLLGYRTNPYKYVAKCDLFVCASYAEGFSTAATEALIVGTPVCTVEVSGMKEMLGEHDEWGIVTENDDGALCRALRDLLTDPARLAHYREKAAERGKMFSTNQTVRAVENMLESL